MSFNVFNSDEKPADSDDFAVDDNIVGFFEYNRIADIKIGIKADNIVSNNI